MENYIWVIQAALALFFIMPGIIKLRMSREQLVKERKILPNGSTTFIRTLGVAELMGSMAMIVTLWVHSLSILALLASAGFTIVMIGALFAHTKKKEFKVTPVLLIALVLSMVVFVHNMKIR